MQTIGQTLKQTRESKRLTLEKVFEATRIRVPYLQALESDDLSAMPSPVQARGYLRNYAEYLGLNFDQLLDEMRVQTSSDEMLTPMDSTPAQADSTPPLDSAQATTPLSTGQPARRKKADSKPASFDAAQDKPDPSPSKPRRATDSSPSKSRRAKTGAKSATDSSPSRPRRERKKIEPEPELVIEPQVEITESIQEAEPEPIVEQPVIQDSVSEESHQPDVSDGLWQSWLNRLSSVITIRAKVKQESLPIVPQVEEETPQLADDDQSEPSTSQPEDSQPSDEIFKEIGRELRARREMLGLHLDEVERNTHVKAHYLEALEAARWRISRPPCRRAACYPTTRRSSTSTWTPSSSALPTRCKRATASGIRKSPPVSRAKRSLPNCRRFAVLWRAILSSASALRFCLSASSFGRSTAW
ncbi:MAG: helix-turn-helix domain-containing protein [Anaerolineales bacterium]